MAKFAVVNTSGNGKADFEIHRAGCADIKRGILKRHFNPEVDYYDEEDADAVERIERDIEFGSSTVQGGPRDGQDVDDATMGEAGFTYRILPCAR